MATTIRGTLIEFAEAVEKAAAALKLGLDELEISADAENVGPQPITDVVGEISPGERVILEFIGKIEGAGNYNAVFGNARSKKDLSVFTLDQIHNMQQEHGNRTGSSAFGKYQIIRKTLLGLRKNLGLTGKELFTPALQDSLAIVLLEGRGLRRWEADKIGDESFMNNIALEWASLPDSDGYSHYDHVMKNKALVTRAQVKQMLTKAKAAGV